MLVDSTTQDGVGQRVALCLYFPAAVDELMTVLCCVYGVQHDGECAAGRILHADRYVDAAGNEAVLLAQESDFFSIGTNDLTQYILAADRNAPEAKRLYTPFHPAVLRELRDVIRAGRQAGIPVGLCGEAAADPELLPLLLAWGLEELSVSPALLLETRARIAGWTAAEAGAVERQVMALAGPEEIRAYYDAWPHN